MKFGQFIQNSILKPMDVAKIEIFNIQDGRWPPYWKSSYPPLKIDELLYLHSGLTYLNEILKGDAEYLFQC